MAELMDRYIKNFSTLSIEENKHINCCRVCIVGCGGLGGYNIELLGRMGVGYLTVVDSDVFELSNLNRQLLSDENSLGKNKALVARERMQNVNGDIKVIPILEKLTEENGKAIIAGHDVVVDALDNMKTRIILQNYCEELNIPLVHGAIEGWYGQVCTIFPGERTIDKLYSNVKEKNTKNKLGNPSFTPSLVASLQVSEVIKILIGRGDLLRNKILSINTLEHEYTILNLE